MDTTTFFQKIRTYTALSEESEAAWTGILRSTNYKKGSFFVQSGQVPRKLAFVCAGLFSQYYVNKKGDAVIKYFFPEGRIAGSVPATLMQSESLFSIEALEDCEVLEYDFFEFKKLVSAHRDIAEFYIRYMEKHWIIEKEMYEISLRNETAASRYDDFLKKYPGLVKRLKKHHVAAFLGITPTQMSRIFFAGK